MLARQPIPRGDDEIANVPVGVVGQEILDMAIGGNDRRDRHADLRLSCSTQRS
jgi:hypothetical protein